MPEAKTEQDPSIEEILESIRQIINEDGDTPADTGGADLRPKNEPPQGGVLNALTEEDVPASDLALGGDAPEEMTGGVLDLTEKVESLSAAEDNLGDDLMNPAYDPDPPPVIDLQEATAMTVDEESLLSDKTADAAAAEMAKLLANNVAVERDEPARVGRVTLEDIARDLMRPLIKTWLDENLPRVIDRVVTRELEKIARRARDE
ncbi:MAG TPA: DUF2497 domain-containing protein [Alphaproteobacteria bacterium]|nr:DUF2497 domain-containing protein [Alphaproteobacteria bacterium]